MKVAGHDAEGNSKYQKSLHGAELGRLLELPTFGDLLLSETEILGNFKRFFFFYFNFALVAPFLCKTNFSVCSLRFP
jgi:hypothetical protein